MIKTKSKAFNYYYGRGRRKTSSAQVRVFPKKQDFDFLVNNQKAEDYFDKSIQLNVILDPIKLSKLSNYSISVKVRGGGKKAQAEAIRLGISRALVNMDKGLKTILKKSGFLTRDSREKERKKYGLKKARRAPQWSKR